MQVVGHGLNNVAKGLLPQVNTPVRRRIIASALDKCDAEARREVLNKSKSKNVAENTSVQTNTPSSSSNMINQMLQLDAFQSIRPFLVGKKPKDRRPIIAAFAKSMKRKQSELAIGDTISQHEWRHATKHACYPGPMEPVEAIKSSRTRFKLQDLEKWLANLDANYTQRHAYGWKNCELASGANIQVDATSTTASSTKIARDCAAEESKGVDNTNNANRCSKTCSKSGRHCLLQKRHDETCRFTPPGGMSYNSMKRLLDCLTNGSLKSLAGLDDEDTLKGGCSIKRLHEVCHLIVDAANLPQKEVKILTEKINDCYTWHKCGYKAHLQRNGVKICQCISCGLSARDKPKTKKPDNSKKPKKPTKVCYDNECNECKLRDDGIHEGPCNDCEKSFQVFSDLLRIAQRVKALPNLSCPDKEKYLELELEIKKCRQNLIDWRSHIVRKKVESDFTRNQNQSLKQNEAVVVSDYKMKILATYFRENQKKFFAKRGTSCLGFMILTNVDSKEGTVDVNFVLLFSNDTTQDANFVLSAKAYIYSEFVPTLFPDDIGTINVKFESDGAGCFNSSALKGCQPYWHEWTEGKVEEVQVRHSVNGDGKTP